MGSIGDSDLSLPPKARQLKAGILVDHVLECGLQLGGIDMLGIDAPHRLPVNRGRGMTRRLAGTQVASIAENREEIALGGVRELGIGT